MLVFLPSGAASTPKAGQHFLNNKVLLYNLHPRDQQGSVKYHEVAYGATHRHSQAWKHESMQKKSDRNKWLFKV